MKLLKDQPWFGGLDAGLTPGESGSEFRCRRWELLMASGMAFGHKNLKGIKKVKVHTLDIAPLRSETPPKKR